MRLHIDTDLGGDPDDLCALAMVLGRPEVEIVGITTCGDRLAASGPLGELLARQCRAHAVDSGMTELGRAHAGLPDDLVNIHWDPVACAVALGWSGAVVQERRVRTVLEAERLRFEHDPGGRRTRVLAGLDVQAFDELWIEAVEQAQR
ncbi:hypothetical protein [Nonomuraea sp. GTA35]|uniref:hypothetical protein n=1 Tax=Nonomuraea sp. GTA35 TaxID=1676746 RepID=UPI0035C03E16